VVERAVVGINALAVHTLMELELEDIVEPRACRPDAVELPPHTVDGITKPL
jgi:hypothetical protein